MARMARMATKKSYSWWWDSHINPNNSKWLADNLKEMDRCVKEMLGLIEEEGDSFAKKADMYYQRRPDLIAHVEDFLRMYRALAERYDNVTGELRKNVPSELQSQGSGTESDFGSEPDSPSPEPVSERRPPCPKPGPRAAGFVFFLGSTGSSDHSIKGSDGSSSSEPDSDDSKHANGDGDGDSSALHQRIRELENELHTTIEKLHEYEGIIANLEGSICNLKEEIKHFSEENSLLARKDIDRDFLIRELQANAATSAEQYLHEKTHLEGIIANLEGSIGELKEEIKMISEDGSLLEWKHIDNDGLIRELQANAATSAEQFSKEKCALEARLSVLSFSHDSLEAKVVSLVSEITWLWAVSAQQLEELSRNLNTVKRDVDRLSIEKEEFGAKVNVLIIDVKSRDERIYELNEHLHQLHLEHFKLITELEETRKEAAGLHSRVRELEEEVDRQRVVIVDSAEGKREAIRQLCFSLEHYQDGYRQLRRVLQAHKWPAGIAT